MTATARTEGIQDLPKRDGIGMFLMDSVIGVSIARDILRGKRETESQPMMLGFVRGTFKNRIEQN